MQIYDSALPPFLFSFCNIDFATFSGKSLKCSWWRGGKNAASDVLLPQDTWTRAFWPCSCRDLQQLYSWGSRRWIFYVGPLTDQTSMPPWLTFVLKSPPQSVQSNLRSCTAPFPSLPTTSCESGPSIMASPLLTNSAGSHRFVLTHRNLQQ